MVKVKYQGKMFPRTVLFDGRRKVVFHQDRRICELDMDDTLSLLQSNKQVSRGVWEFVIIENIEKNEEPKKLDISVDSPVAESVSKKKYKKYKKEE